MRAQRGAAGPATVASVAVALAVLAVLAVVSVTAVAAVRFSADDAAPAPAPDPSSPSSPSSPTEEESEPAATFFPDGQVLTGDRRDNADVEVPSVEEGWEYSSSDYTQGYQAGEEDDFATVGVSEPYLWDVATCGGSEGPRAWTGFGAPGVSDGEPDVARRAAEQTVDRWVEVLGLVGAETEQAGFADASISDGTEAVGTRLTVTFPDERDDPCQDPATEIRFLSFDTGEYVATVILVRGIETDGSDLEDGLPADVADQILASARQQEAP